MLTTQTNMIAVVNQELKPQNITGEAPINIREANGTIVNNVGPGENRPIVCFRCNREGHRRRYCRTRIEPKQEPQGPLGQFHQNGQFQANGNNYMQGNQPLGNAHYRNMYYPNAPAQPMLNRPNSPVQPNIPYQPQRPVQPAQQLIQQNPGRPDHARNQNRAPPENAGNPANQAAASPRAGNNINQVPLN